ncbi:alpha-hydroxy-acid oxidizing protein [Pseudomonas juntendi]|nr:alpha-hydroxy-acid oxidizing protein [Pseudomonas juntendi]PYC08100.1 hypothetical protein DMX12_04000 [Pseudomonas sp. MB-090624]
MVPVLPDAGCCKAPKLPGTKSGGQVPLLFDSGIRRGLDVVKAIAAGVDLVAIGHCSTPQAATVVSPEQPVCDG